MINTKVEHGGTEASGHTIVIDAEGDGYAWGQLHLCNNHLVHRLTKGHRTIGAQPLMTEEDTRRVLPEREGRLTSERHLLGERMKTLLLQQSHIVG